jgi:hypothetical protein
MDDQIPLSELDAIKAAAIDQAANDPPATDDQRAAIAAVFGAVPKPVTQ